MDLNSEWDTIPGDYYGIFIVFYARICSARRRKKKVSFSYFYFYALAVFEYREEGFYPAKGGKQCDKIVVT